jgi:hypothetical protein
MDSRQRRISATCVKRERENAMQVEHPAHRYRKG